MLKALNPSFPVLRTCMSSWLLQCRRFAQKSQHNSDPFASVNQFDPRLRGYLLKVKNNYSAVLQNQETDPLSSKHVHSFQDLQAISSLADKLLKAENELQELKNMDAGGDADLIKMITEECEKIGEVFNLIQDEVTRLIIPENRDQIEGLIMELSAGVGGQEAMLFCGELFDMYCNYCDSQGWESNVLNFESSELEGARHASLSIEHPAAYEKLKFESGVHRVQRTPKTEKSGRVHTSTVAVVILPKPSEVSINIDPKDLRVETKRASGAGGQHVNTTESAVRITHLPTGIMVECQTQRSQIQNRQVAMANLRARLYQIKLDEQLASTRSSRKLQMGSSARSEKIRTYNFPQDRVTDHRINYTCHNHGEFLRGGRPLDALLEKLREESRRERLSEFLDNEVP